MQGSKITKSTSLAERTRVVVLVPLVATLVYLMLWTVTTPPKIKTLVAKENTSANGVVTQYEQDACSPGSLAWHYPILVLELAILGYTMLLAYETRKLNRALLDGKQMSYVLYNFLLWGVTAFVLFLALDLQATEPSVAFFVVCLTCVLCYVLSLSILLGPKLWKAATTRERRLTLSDYLKPLTYFNSDDYPRDDSRVELPQAPITEDAAAGETVTPVQEQHFL